MNIKAVLFGTHHPHREPQTRLRKGALLVSTVLFAGIAGTPAQGAILPSPPTRTASSEESGFPIGSAFDNHNGQEWRTSAALNEGTNATVHMEFAGPTTFDRVAFINHNGSNAGSNTTTQISLSFDGGPALLYSVYGFVARSSGSIIEVGPRTATTIDLRITQVFDGSAGGQVGAGEVFFLNTPTGNSRVSGVTVTAFSSQISIGPATNILNQRLSSGRSAESAATFSSNGDGTNTFVDFDLGYGDGVTGFDFFDRTRPDTGVGTVTGFDLIFSVDSTFGNADDVTRSYAKAGTAIALSDSFAPISARYVRYDVTALNNPGFPNVGGSHFTFYVPEPSAAVLLGLAAVSSAVCSQRRRR